jgi:hypothetical protein
MVLLSDVLIGLILPSDPLIRKNDARMHAWTPMYIFFNCLDSPAGEGRPQVLSISQNFGV